MERKNKTLFVKASLSFIPLLYLKCYKCFNHGICHIALQLYIYMPLSDSTDLAFFTFFFLNSKAEQSIWYIESIRCAFAKSMNSVCRYKNMAIVQEERSLLEMMLFKCYENEAQKLSLSFKTVGIRESWWFIRGRMPEIALYEQDAGMNLFCVCNLVH